MKKCMKSLAILTAAVLALSSCGNVEVQTKETTLSETVTETTETQTVVTETENASESEELTDTENASETEEITKTEEMTDTAEDSLTEETKTEETENETKVYSFNEALNEYIRNMYADENYMLSPMSFRYALCLLIAGAEGDTQAELLKAAGFSDVEECYTWAAALFSFSDEFNSRMSDELPSEEESWMLDEPVMTGGFSIANSIWHNTASDCDLKEDYISEMQEKLQAEAANVDPDKLQAAINDWCNEKTKGLIPDIVGEEVADMDTILANALYFKSAWCSQFYTANDITTFTCKDGSEAEKSFMRLQEDFLYYEDEETRLVVVPMYGDVDVVFVDGSSENLDEKISKAEYQEVVFTLPKFETASNFNSNELMEFLADQGVKLAFSGQADFSNMTEASLAVSSIIQKTKISLDEDGLEAAAVTVIMMETTAFIEDDPPQPIEFTLDHEFSYYIYANTSAEEDGNVTYTPELMFCGQVVK